MKFAVVGHITEDILVTDEQEAVSPGGSASYCSFMAKGLGVTPVPISKAKHSFEFEKEGIDISGILKSGKITTFVNKYTGGNRFQRVLEVAEPLNSKDIPEACLKSDIIHIGPVVGEVPLSTVEFLRKNSNALISADMQGFVRQLRGNKVVKKKFQLENIINNLDIVKISWVDEFDCLFSSLDEAKQFFKKHGKIGLITMGEEGSWVFADCELRVPAFKTKTIDPTGAGDAYVTCFDIMYLKTKDLMKSALFASAAASFVVEDWGLENIPNEKMVLERLKSHK